MVRIVSCVVVVVTVRGRMLVVGMVLDGTS
jgi:hypothetical protein